MCCENLMFRCVYSKHVSLQLALGAMNSSATFSTCHLWCRIARKTKHGLAAENWHRLQRLCHTWKSDGSKASSLHTRLHFLHTQQFTSAKNAPSHHWSSVFQKSQSRRRNECRFGLRSFKFCLAPPKDVKARWWFSIHQKHLWEGPSKTFFFNTSFNTACKSKNKIPCRLTQDRARRQHT